MYVIKVLPSTEEARQEIKTAFEIEENDNFWLKSFQTHKKKVLEMQLKQLKQLEDRKHWTVSTKRSTKWGGGGGWKLFQGKIKIKTSALVFLWINQSNKIPMLYIHHILAH